MPLPTKLLAFKRLIKAYDDGVSIEELRRQRDDLEQHVKKLQAEYEEHLNTVRFERDQIDFQLNEFRAYVEGIVNSIDRDIPSVTAQNAWRAGLFNFGKAVNHPVPGTRYFNCSIVARLDGDWLIARKSAPFPRVEIGKNSIAAFKIQNDFFRKPPEQRESAPALFTMIHCAFQERYSDEHFEDPRVCVMNGQVYISCTNFQLSDKGRWRGSHQVLVEVDDLWRSRRMWHPVFGGNQGSPYLQKYNEKNWLWFWHEGEIYMVYMTVPHRVVHMNKFIDLIKVYETPQRNPLWKAGAPRGGTPPVRVGDEYFSFFHSSTAWICNKRRYHMGAYAFEAKPPFRMTKCTTLPLLSGSKDDPPFNGLVPPVPTIPLCVFPGGAIYRDGKWIVVYGVNDFTSGWIEIPHVDLLNLMRPIGENDVHGEEMVMTNQAGIPLDGNGLSTKGAPIFANPPAEGVKA
jgi:predicted GH43/DUF377 family glycosyl hydrolase